MNIRKIVFAFWLFFIVSQTANSQQTKFQIQIDFVKSIKNVGNIIITNDGSYLLCGTLVDPNGEYPFLLKVSTYGQIDWKIIFEASLLPSKGKFVTQTPDGGYLLLGETELNSTDKDILLIRTDSNGNLLWNKTYGNSEVDLGNNIVCLPSGNFVIFGESTAAGIKKGVAIRINPDGDVLETNYFDVAYAASSVKGKLFGPNQITVTGTGITEIFTDTSGIYIGQSSIQLPDSSNTVDVIVTPTGRHITIANMFQASSSGHQMYMTNADTAGNNPGWISLFGQSAYSIGNTTLMLATNGNYYIAGELLFTFGYGHLFLTEIDTAGNTLWMINYEPAPYYLGGGAVATSDGGFLISSAGYVNSNKYDLFIVKTDSSGYTGCLEIDFLTLFQATGNYFAAPQLAGNSGNIQNIGTPLTLVSSSYGTRTELCYTAIENIDPFNASTIKFHPNPFINNITFELPAKVNGPFQLTVYDIQGSEKLHLSSPDVEFSGSELEKLPPGMYIAELNIPGHPSVYVKLIHD